MSIVVEGYEKTERVFDTSTGGQEMYTSELLHKEPDGEVCPECGSDRIGDKVEVVTYSDPGYPHGYESTYWCKEEDCRAGPWRSLEDLMSREEFEEAQEEREWAAREKTSHA